MFYLVFYNGSLACDDLREEMHFNAHVLKKGPLGHEYRNTLKVNFQKCRAIKTRSVQTFIVNY